MRETRERFATYVRQWTGKPVSRAHVLDRETGKIVASCPHLHRQRRHRGFGPDGAPIVTSSVTYAERCAAKLLRAFLAPRAPETETAARAASPETAE